MKCCCRVAPQWPNPSGRISSSSGPGSGVRPDARPGAPEPAFAAPVAAGTGPQAAPAPGAVVPAAVAPWPRLFGCSCSCGGAGGADAPATAPGRWPGPAPVQTGTASILSSCVNFLVRCYLLHCVSWFSRFLPGAELPLPAACPGLDGDHDGERRISSQDIAQTAPEPDSARNLP